VLISLFHSQPAIANADLLGIGVWPQPDGVLVGNGWVKRDGNPLRPPVPLHSEGNFGAGRSITQPFRLTRPRRAGTAMKRSIQFFDTYVKGVNP
jgi:hypothetical protein